MQKTMSQSNSDANINLKGRTHMSIPGLTRELKNNTLNQNERDKIIRKSCTDKTGYESDDNEEKITQVTVKRKPRVDTNLS